MRQLCICSTFWYTVTTSQQTAEVDETLCCMFSNWCCLIYFANQACCSVYFLPLVYIADVCTDVWSWCLFMAVQQRDGDWNMPVIPSLCVYSVSLACAFRWRGLKVFVFCTCVLLLKFPSHTVSRQASKSWQCFCLLCLLICMTAGEKNKSSFEQACICNIKLSEWSETTGFYDPPLTPLSVVSALFAAKCFNKSVLKEK